MKKGFSPILPEEMLASGWSVSCQVGQGGGKKGSPELPWADTRKHVEPTNSPLDTKRAGKVPVHLLKAEKCLLTHFQKLWS